MHWSKEDALCKALGKAYINYYAKTKKSALFDMVYLIISLLIVLWPAKDGRVFSGVFIYFQKTPSLASYRS